MTIGEIIIILAAAAVLLIVMAIIFRKKKLNNQSEESLSKAQNFKLICKKNNWHEFSAPQYNGIISDIVSKKSSMLKGFSGGGAKILFFAKVAYMLEIYFFQFSCEDNIKKELYEEKFDALVLKTSKNFPYTKITSRISAQDTPEYISKPSVALSPADAGGGYKVYTELSDPQRAASMLNGSKDYPAFGLIKKYGLTLELSGNYAAVYCTHNEVINIEKFVSECTPLLYEAESLSV